MTSCADMSSGCCRRRSNSTYAATAAEAMPMPAAVMGLSGVATIRNMSASCVPSVSDEHGAAPRCCANTTEDLSDHTLVVIRYSCTLCTRAVCVWRLRPDCDELVIDCGIAARASPSTANTNSKPSPHARVSLVCHSLHCRNQHAN